MTDALTPKQTLLLWCLLARRGVAAQKTIEPEVKAPDRRVLEKKRYVSSGGRPLVIKLEDAGWAWAAEHLGDPLPKNYGALRDFLVLLKNHLAETGGDLSGFIGTPQQLIDPTPSLRRSIESAYLAVTGGRTGVDAKLADVRRKLPPLDRAIVDAELRVMQSEGKARLMRQDDRRALTAADEDAALRHAGEAFHILWIF